MLWFALQHALNEIDSLKKEVKTMKGEGKGSERGEGK